MNVGFIGTQLGMTINQLAVVERMLSQFVGIAGEHHGAGGHHGDSVGADDEFHDICRRLGIEVHIHPPVEPRRRAYCKGAASVAPEKHYLVRGREIVDTTDVLMAAPSGSNEKPRSVTWSTVRYARRKGKPIHIILPDGNVTIEGVAGAGVVAEGDGDADCTIDAEAGGGVTDDADSSP